MIKQDIVNILSQIRPNSTFCSVMNYTNDKGEVSSFSLAFHVTYSTILERSIAKLKTIDAKTAIEDIAKKELLASYLGSVRNIDAGNYSNMQEFYDYFFDEEGNVIKCVKMHRESGAIHINGYEVHKVIVKPFKYPVRNSSAKTKAKIKLASQLPISKYRQFKLVPDRFEHITVEKMKIMPPID